MANLRLFKKSINDKMYEIIDEAYSAEIDNSANAKDVNVIVEEAVKLRNDLIARLNDNKSIKEAKPTKQYFNQVKDDLISGATSLQGKVDKLA